MSHPDSKDHNHPADSLEDALGKPGASQHHPYRQPHQGHASHGGHNPFGGQGRPNPFGQNNPFNQRPPQSPQQGSTPAPQADNPLPQPAAADTAPTPDHTAELTALQGRITELENEVKDVQSRANAEMYNLQKRVEREVDGARKYALEKFAGNLLDVVDNLERAIDAGGGTDDPLTQGVQLTLKSLVNTLEKFGVEVVNPVQAPFDADLHQAVGIAPGVPANQVGQVLQKGYTLNGRLLRPAMVMVGQ